MLRDLIATTRSCRRFQEKSAVAGETLRELVDLARLAASAANLQPLKYMLSFTPEKNAAVFPHLRWAGYLTDWDCPAEGERPAAYIVVLGDTTVTRSFGCDHGIAVQNIMLGATEKGLGGCMFGSIDRKRLRKAIGVPDHCEILLVVALGIPAERVVLEDVGEEGDIEYWRDDEGIHHVPKRALDDIILE